MPLSSLLLVWMMILLFNGFIYFMLLLISVALGLQAYIMLKVHQLKNLLVNFYGSIYKKSDSEIEQFISEYKNAIDKFPVSEQEKGYLKDKFSMVCEQGQDQVPEKDQVCCIVCIGEFEKDENVLLFPGCKHPYHYNCIETWLTKKVKCPTCRSSMREEIMRNLNKDNTKLPNEKDKALLLPENQAIYD